MSPTHPAIWKPAVLVGVSLGLLASIPFLGSCLNTCCCGLAAIAGLIAAMLYLSETEATPKAPYGDGLLVGLMTGAIGAMVLVASMAVFGVVAAVFDWSLRPRINLDELVERGDVPPFVQELLDFVVGGGSLGIGLLIALAVWVVIYSLSGAIGGIVGVAVFHGTRQGPAGPAASPPAATGTGGPYVPPPPPPPPAT